MYEYISAPIKVYSRYGDQILAPLGLDTPSKYLDLKKWHHFPSITRIMFLVMREGTQAIFKVVWNETPLEIARVDLTNSQGTIQFSAKSPSISCKYMVTSRHMKRFQLAFNSESEFSEVCALVTNLGITVKEARPSVPGGSKMAPPPLQTLSSMQSATQTPLQSILSQPPMHNYSFSQSQWIPEGPASFLQTSDAESLIALSQKATSSQLVELTNPGEPFLHSNQRPTKIRIPLMVDRGASASASVQRPANPYQSAARPSINSFPSAPASAQPPAEPYESMARTRVEAYPLASAPAQPLVRPYQSATQPPVKTYPLASAPVQSPVKHYQSAAQPPVKAYPSASGTVQSPVKPYQSAVQSSVKACSAAAEWTQPSYKPYHSNSMRIQTPINAHLSSKQSDAPLRKPTASDQQSLTLQDINVVAPSCRKPADSRLNDSASTDLPSTIDKEQNKLGATKAIENTAAPKPIAVSEPQLVSIANAKPPRSLEPLALENKDRFEKLYHKNRNTTCADFKISKKLIKQKLKDKEFMKWVSKVEAVLMEFTEEEGWVSEWACSYNKIHRRNKRTGKAVIEHQYDKFRSQLKRKRSLSERNWNFIRLLPRRKKWLGVW